MWLQDFGSSGPFFAAAAASSVDSGNPFLSPGPWVPPAAAHSSGGVFQPTADAASNKRQGLSISGEARQHNGASAGSA
jgi:hypothetical protein